MQVKVIYQSGTRKVFKINTPNRKRGKVDTGKLQIYDSNDAVSSRKFSFIIEMGRKIIREIHILSSDEYDSFLRSPIEALNNFSWDKVMTELSKALPTPITLLQFLIPNAADKKPFVCFVASLLLKCRHQRMSLIQRAISVLLNGNGSTKQVGVLLF